MNKILISAFACGPDQGSEPGNGWNWALGLASRKFEVHCLTRSINREGIEHCKKPDNLTFHYVKLPFGLEFLYSFSEPTMYIYYLLWQWKAYRKAKGLFRKHKFILAHHVTWGSLQMGSFLHKLKIPFYFGPAGGGQHAPESFKKYFFNHWKSERRRRRISQLMIKYNPAFRGIVKHVNTLFVSNHETFDMAKRAGVKNCQMSLDAVLPVDFFQSQPEFKNPELGKLKLLWVGRFMPRKGTLLLLDVMNLLKDYPGIILTVVGDGLFSQVIIERIKELNLEMTVKLVGKVPFAKVKHYYSTNDVFFYTSLRDSGGVQILEAMAFAMPVVTLNLHGQSMIVSDQTGIRCSVESPEKTIKELKSAILYLYNNPNLVSEMSKVAYDFAKQQTWDRKIDKIIKEYYPQVL